MGMEQNTLTRLNADLLAEQIPDPRQQLREDLEDTIKEYNELDLLVELLQNALDAIDLKRYCAICASAGRDPDDHDTVRRWNESVLEALGRDYDQYPSH